MSYKIDAIDFIHAANSTSSGATIVSKILVLCNGNIFIGGVGGWLGIGSNLYSASQPEISTVGAAQKFYIVDGASHTSGSLIQLNAIDASIGRVATGGSGQPPSQARLATLYRNRLVLSRTESDPYNWFMSAAGAHTTFDYSDETATGAVAGNNSVAGKIGDIITCCAAITDDYMVMGCQDSVWLLRGDPKTGGRIDNLSWGGGIVGPKAWARDSEGFMYYLSRTDLMAIPPGGGTPQSVSQGRLQKFLSDINHNQVTVRMAYDAQLRQLFIYFTPTTAGPATHLLWDKQANAFSTLTFPDVYGPTAVRALTGETFQNRQILLGNFTGNVWTYSPYWLTDDGTPIDCAVKFSPMALADVGMRGVIRETQFVTGDGHPFPSMTWLSYVGDTPQDAMNSTDSKANQIITTVGTHVNRDRARGNTVVFKITSGDAIGSWSFEQGHVVVSPGGSTK